VTRMMKLWWSLTAVVVVLGVAGLTTGVASAQKDDTSTKLVVDRVDAREDEVVVSGSLTGADPSSIELTVDGAAYEPTSAVTLAESGGRNEVIVVLDNAEALGNATVQLAKSALSHLMPGEGATSTLGVISTGGKVSVDAGPSANESAIRAGLDGIHPAGVSYTWDGVARAADLLEERDRGTTGTVVLFTGSASAATGAPSTVASSALQRAGVRLDVVALPKGADVGTAGEIVAERGGTLDLVNSDEDLDGAFAQLASSLEGRFELTFPAPADAGSIVPMTLTSGSATAELSFTPGAVRTGSFGLAPITSDGSGGFFSSSLVKWTGLLLGVVAVMLILWTVLTMVLPSESNLVSRLEVYEENYGAEDDSLDAPNAGQATVPIIRRAVELTGEMAERRGVLDKIETKLERANLPLRAAEAMFFAAAAVLILTVLTFVLTGNFLMTLVAAALAVITPVALLNLRIRKRQKAFVALLPDMLTLLAGTLKAGYSVAQGFESVSGEIDEPMGRELRRVVTETRLGRPLEEALEAVAERMDSDDFAWAVMAIRIQREVGGNLAELLSTVADTMTQRERLRREVSTLTAEGRLSAVIIGLLPPGLAGALAVLNPEYIGGLFEPGLGYGLLAGAIVMMLIGFAWMKKTITIEV
jgi:tight adherence protein B